ncbi:MAG: hypothetical protein LIR50_03105 [Bacillota bacterium]|nr:hypothetical protein [Bacillota bacterium]
MKVDIAMIEIERHNYPSNSDINQHIKNIKKINIGQLITHIVPQIGEVIAFENKNYRVAEVIRTVKNKIEQYTV